VGYQGYTGAQGYQGATGRGCVGPTGAQGPIGFTGRDGSPGGAQGATGAVGATGSSSPWIPMNGVEGSTGGYTGIGITGQDVLIYGNLLVTGGIDPTYLALTPQPSGPQGFVNPLWLDNSGNLRSASFNFSEQLILPNTFPSLNPTFSSSTLTCNFNSKSTGIFSFNLIGGDMTDISFNNPVIGGQYVIYVTHNTLATTRTIASTLTGTPNRTNYTSAVSVTTTTSALLTITYDGTRYLIACSAFN
jgi:hypothetical protein